MSSTPPASAGKDVRARDGGPTMFAVKLDFGARQRRAATTRQLDPIDLKILAKLQGDGRITTVRLAEHVNLSPSACHERVTYLTDRGFIKRFRAEVDLQRIVKYDMLVVAFTLGNHNYQSFDRFEKRIAGVPEVVECIAVGGGIDYIVKFVVTHIACYQELLEGLLQEDIGIKQYFTYVATKVIKPMASLPIEHLHALSRRRAERS